MIPTIWDSSNADPEAKKLPKKIGIGNMFTSTNLTKEQVKVKSELVWEDTTFVNTPRYFKIFDTNPTDDDTLNVERNNMKVKHVIMGKKIWSSFKSEFQIEILGNNSEYKIGEEYDGPMLWDYIRRRIKPSTRVEASKLKGNIEKKEVRDFGNGVSKYNTWFEDTRRSIIYEEGEG